MPPPAAPIRARAKPRGGSPDTRTARRAPGERAAGAASETAWAGPETAWAHGSTTRRRLCPPFLEKRCEYPARTLEPVVLDRNLQQRVQEPARDFLPLRPVAQRHLVAQRAQDVQHSGA